MSDIIFTPATLYKHSIRLYRKPAKWAFNHDEVIIAKEPVLAENDIYIVLNDLHFTKLEKKGDGVLYSTIGKPNIRFKDALGEQGVFYTLYSTAKRRVATIEKEIRAQAEKQYGWLFSNELDLTALLKGIEA